MTNAAISLELSSAIDEEPLPSSFVIESALHRRPPVSYEISTGAHVSLDRLTRRRSAPPPDAIAGALFVSALGLVVAAGSAVALLVA